MMDNWNRRYGKLRYPREWIDEHPFELMAALHEFIPLEAKFDWASNSVEVMGLHPMFNVVGEGYEAPFYDFNITIERDNQGREIEFVIKISRYSWPFRANFKLPKPHDESLLSYEQGKS